MYLPTFLKIKILKIIGFFRNRTRNALLTNRYIFIE